MVVFSAFLLAAAFFYTMFVNVNTDVITPFLVLAWGLFPIACVVAATVLMLAAAGVV